MSKIRTALNLFLSDRDSMRWALKDNLAKPRCSHYIPDKLMISLQYYCVFGKWPNLRSPSSFNEKMQWMKLYDRNPLYTTLVDKLAVKKWVFELIGERYVAETYGVWGNANDIDFDALPERFVLKTNHDSGGVVICRNRESFDYAAAKCKLNDRLRSNLFWYGREWPYKNVRPLVFAEEYLSPDESGDLPDYKLFRFGNGKIITLVCEDRFLGTGLKKTFFDDEWQAIPLTEGKHGRNPGRPAPASFGKMKELAHIIADGFPFVRVDFYESCGRLYFGEVTFFPNSGLEQFDPPEWDETLGSWIDLSGAYGA